MRARMTVACVLILAPFLLISCRLLVATTSHAEEEVDARMLQKLAYGAAGIVEDRQGQPETVWQESLSQFVNDRLAPLKQKRGLALMVLEGPERRVAWRSQPDAPPWPIEGRRDWQAAFAKAPPDYGIVVAWPRQSDWRALAYERWGLGGLSLLVILAVSAGAWLLVGRTLLPIRLLSRQASAASVENLHIRLHAPSRDAEIVDLVGTLNGLLARLSETAAAKGRFYSAASHELRTPLQALSGHLEVALSRPRTAQEYAAALHEAYRQTGRLAALTRDLLLLHQLDTASASPGPQEPVDLAEVCAQVLGPLEPLIEARGLRVQTDLSPGVLALAVPTHAEILVRNLVENALRYAQAGGGVTIRLMAPDGTARLEVFNACPPNPGWDTQKVFEPFYRPDAARNRKTGGNGLGLAICRALAAANGWTVTLEQTPQGVLAVALFGAEPPH
jgi:signal transduction histidine kinase